MDILSEVEALLGKAAEVDHRGWATFWCPFHQDAQRAGRGGRPNLGVNLQEGYWKCLRCGASGRTIDALRKQLGDPTPPRRMTPAILPASPLKIERLLEALAECRTQLPGSPADAYLLSRGLGAYARLTYNLGFGVAFPQVHLDTFQAARDSRLIGPEGAWLWAGGVIYADPPMRPSLIQVRHLRADAPKKYQTWGRYQQPCGAWRIRENTRTLLVVEGLFDMLVAAQHLHDRRLEHSVVPIYTGGATPSRRQLDWFRARGASHEFILIPDSDDAGDAWTRLILHALRRGHGHPRVERTPRKLDPDEAILAGWWPKGL